jgi:hypothetical protein
VGAFRDPAQQMLAQATVSQNLAKVNDLVSRTKLNEPRADDLILLSLAMREKSPSTLPILQALLAAGADRNVASEKGWSAPLSQAISSRQAEVIPALLDRGRPEPEGCTRINRVSHRALLSG